MALPAAATEPASQTVGTADPVAHAWPAGHSAHSDALAKLVELPYVPSLQSRAADAPLPHHAPLSHGRQAVEFWSGWWVPAGHTSHATFPKPGADEPALQGNGAIAPSVHADPGGHASHDARPARRWNRPASHRVQMALPASATDPATHADGTTAPVEHALPSGHFMQSNAAVRFVALPYDPALQSSAADAPSEHHLPSSHGRQPVAFACGWWEPAGHDLHALFPKPGADEPALHADGSVAPSAQADPGGHASHSGWPARRWNQPGSHRMQTAAPAAATDPASHLVGTGRTGKGGCRDAAACHGSPPRQCRQADPA